MTKRLYYHDTFLNEFEGTVTDVRSGDKPAVVLDKTAFYPTSGGQVFDRGKLVSRGSEVNVEQVEEDDAGKILHYIAPSDVQNIRPGDRIRGYIDTGRRRDHMQQHSGQHVLSAAFVQLYQMPTVSFHMGDESCTIDLAVGAISDQQLKKAEELANRVVAENRPVHIRFVPLEEAKKLGLRKLPDVGREELRLIEIADFDLCACGGTHVQSTSQIGPIFVRKSEKVKQGFRVEFVCGDRALRAARRDFETLSQAATLFSAQLTEVPNQIRKTLDDLKAAGKQQHRLLEELAELWAARLAAEAPAVGKFRLVKQVFSERPVAYIKLLAQKLAQQSGVVALLAATADSPTLIFSRSSDVDLNVGALLKEIVTGAGGRGGGTNDLAQGGVPDALQIPALLDKAAAMLQG